MQTPPETTLAEFIQYNNWANQQVFQACQQLSEDRLTEAIPGAFGTIRETLEHIIRAEAHYVRLLTGNRPAPSFQWEDQPSVSQMVEYAVHVGQALTDAAQRIPPTEIIHQESEGKQTHYRALAIFIQIINHGIEHRTNITTILNQGTPPPPEVDGWSYLWARQERFDLKQDA